MTDQSTAWAHQPHTYYARPVQAMLLTPENLEEAARWCGGRVHPDDQPGRTYYLDVPHLEGLFTCTTTQWLIRQWDGQFTAMTGDDFPAIYSSTPELAATDPTAGPYAPGTR